MMPRRLVPGPLLPGLTAGQQNRLTLLLTSRSNVGMGQVFSVYSTADKHAAAALSLYASDESLETRAAALARDARLQPVTAGLMVGLAIGPRLGVQFGRTNGARERHLRKVRERERQLEAERPPFDPVAAKAEHDAAKRWAREMGKATRSRR